MEPPPLIENNSVSSILLHSSFTPVNSESIALEDLPPTGYNSGTSTSIGSNFNGSGDIASSRSGSNDSSLSPVLFRSNTFPITVNSNGFRSVHSNKMNNDSSSPTFTNSGDSAINGNNFNGFNSLHLFSPVLLNIPPAGNNSNDCDDSIPNNHDLNGIHNFTDNSNDSVESYSQDSNIIEITSSPDNLTSNNNDSNRMNNFSSKCGTSSDINVTCDDNFQLDDKTNTIFTSV